MASPKSNTPPTEKELKDFFNYVSREQEKITERQKHLIRELVNKQIFYDPDKLSATFKSEVCRIYAYEMYNKSKLSMGGVHLPTQKGNLAEAESIKMLSKLDGVEYHKNEKVIRNAFLKGKPDIILYDADKKIKKIIDVKTSFDLPTFLSMLNEPCGSDNSWQMTGYLDITGIESGEVVYCLTNMPESIIQAEKNNLIERYQKLDIAGEEVEKRLLQLQLNMVYDEIPIELRVIRYTIDRNGYRIKDLRQRVKLARKWLKELDASFKKPLNLSQTDNPLLEK